MGDPLFFVLLFPVRRKFFSFFWTGKMYTQHIKKHTFFALFKESMNKFVLVFECKYGFVQNAHDS